MLTEKPKGITANRQSLEMTIQWADGHTSVYPFSLLRAACPCAMCRGGHENMRAEPDPEVFNTPLEDNDSTRLANVVATGAYGITLVWADGHDYGIFNWHFLRALCPCPHCRRGK